MSTQPEPFLWICLVHPPGDVARIRAWTQAREQAEHFRLVQDLDMMPLYPESALPCSAGNEPHETKTVYVKRWRTLVKLPAKYADEIVAALRTPTEPQQSAGDVADLIERLRNPMWAHSTAPFLSPQLEQEENLAAMNEAAAEIERLRAPAQTFPMSREQLAKVFAYIWDGDANEWRAFTDKADAFLTCPLTQPESRP